jgi:hypothetical protein
MGGTSSTPRPFEGHERTDLRRGRPTRYDGYMISGTALARRRTSARKRTIRVAAASVVVFALLGVVMSYAVAWGLACGIDLEQAPPVELYRDIRVDFFPPRMGADGSQTLSVSTRNRDLFRLDRCGRSRITLARPRFGGHPEADDLVRVNALIPSTCLPVITAWRILHPPDFNPPSLDDGPKAFWGHEMRHAIDRFLRLEFAGWPMSCCWGGVTEAQRIVGAIDPEERKFSEYPRLHSAFPAPLKDRPQITVVNQNGFWTVDTARLYPILPMAPLWPGLLINTAFYGTILWLLWLTISRGPGMLRRGSRRRRGLCVRCGYDLRGGMNGAPCPECGTGSARAS